MEPTVRGLEDFYSDQVTFLRLNARGDGQAAFEVGNLPGHPAYVLLLPDGTEVWRGFGILDFVEFDTAILDALAR